MKQKKSADDYSDAEAEARANAALRRALSTPYKPQSEMKIGLSKKKKRPTKKRKAVR